MAEALGVGAVYFLLYPIAEESLVKALLLFCFLISSVNQETWTRLEIDFPFR